MPNTAPSILLVLAAGMGSRYGGLKQLDGVGDHGETVLEYAVFDAIRAGFSRVVFVIRRDFELDFREYVAGRFGDRIDVAYAFQSVDDVPTTRTLPNERTKPWGTAHAVWSARAHLDGPFAVVNADDFYGRDAFARVGQYLRMQASGSPAHAALVGFVLANTLSPHGGVSRGVCRADANNHLCGIEELTDVRMTDDGPTNVFPDGSTRRLRGDEIVSMNMWGFFPPVLQPLERKLAHFLETLAPATALSSECYLPACVDALITEGQLCVDILPTRGLWFGVTYPEDKPSVQVALRELTTAKEYPSPLWT